MVCTAGKHVFGKARGKCTRVKERGKSTAPRAETLPVASLKAEHAVAGVSKKGRIDLRQSINLQWRTMIICYSFCLAPLLA